MPGGPDRQLSRSRSGLRHAIGHDDAPSPEEMTRDAPAVTVQPLTLDLVDAMGRVHKDGFGTKACYCCCPHDPTARSFYEKHPERLGMCGVALEGTTPLGYVQLAIYPMNDKDGLHTTKPGEAYVEQISVAVAARGKGVGRMLLQWAEAKAREHQCTILTLAVLNGNPARRLYERFGFVAKSQDDVLDECIGGVVVMCIVGRPYGMCDPHFGAVDMSKPLAHVNG